MRPDPTDAPVERGKCRPQQSDRCATESDDPECGPARATYQSAFEAWAIDVVNRPTPRNGLAEARPRLKLFAWKRTNASGIQATVSMTDMVAERIQRPVDPGNPGR